MELANHGPDSAQIGFIRKDKAFRTLDVEFQDVDIVHIHCIQQGIQAHRFDALGLLSRTPANERRRHAAFGVEKELFALVAISNDLMVHVHIVDDMRQIANLAHTVGIRFHTMDGRLLEVRPEIQGRHPVVGTDVENVSYIIRIWMMDRIRRMNPKLVGQAVVEHVPKGPGIAAAVQQNGYFIGYPEPVRIYGQIHDPVQQQIMPTQPVGMDVVCDRTYPSELRSDAVQVRHDVSDNTWTKKSTGSYAGPVLK